MKEVPTNIQQLIEAKQPATNFLALQLLIDQLHWSFSEAILCLPLQQSRPDLYQLVIGELCLSYQVDYVRDFDFSSEWAEIERKLTQTGQLVANSVRRLFIDEGSWWLVEKGRPFEQLIVIQADILALAPQIEQLLLGSV